MAMRSVVRIAGRRIGAAIHDGDNRGNHLRSSSSDQLKVQISTWAGNRTPKPSSSTSSVQQTALSPGGRSPKIISSVRVGGNPRWKETSDVSKSAKPEVRGLVATICAITYVATMVIPGMYAYARRPKDAKE